MSAFSSLQSLAAESPNCFKVVLIDLLKTESGEGWNGGGKDVLEHSLSPSQAEDSQFPGSQPGGSLSADARPSPGPLPDLELGLVGGHTQTQGMSNLRAGYRQGLTRPSTRGHSQLGQVCPPPDQKTKKTDLLP